MMPAGQITSLAQLLASHVTYALLEEGIPCWLPKACTGRLDTTAGLYCVKLWLTMRMSVLRSRLATAFPP